MLCAICQHRKAKRSCPGIHGEICAPCCGREREESVDCPLDCPYLIEARQHEKVAGITPEEFPYKEIRITESYLQEREELLNALGQFVLGASFSAFGAADGDVREALDALVRTYKSLESGVYYESRAESPVAQQIAGQVQDLLRKFREEETARGGMTRTRDADVLGILVFLLRMAMDRNNGRKRGRAFIDFLRSHFAAGQPAPAQSPLIVPG